MSTCNVDNNMLTQQQQTTNQINQLLAQTSQSLLCGPGTECEKTQKTQDLQQKYLAAQTLLQSAPVQEQTAEKDFYVYTQGDAAYNNMLNQRLAVKANVKVNEINVSFTENTKKAKELNDTLGSLTTNYQHVLELNNNYIEENDELKRQINSYKNNLTTNDRKTYYEDQNFDILNYWFTIWRWIYFTLVTVFGVAIFLTKSSYSIWIKLILLLLLIIYPFVINIIVFYLLKLLVSIQSLLPKNVYTTL